MTSDDELLKRLEGIEKPFRLCLREYDKDCNCDRCQAAARIRELLAQLPEGMEHCTIEFKECEHGHGRLVATNWLDHGCHFCRIRELEAELDSLGDLSEWEKVCAGTHTIVPVEPTPHMVGVGKAAFDLDLNTHNLVMVLYRAMIRAAQESKQ